MPISTRMWRITQHVLTIRSIRPDLCWTDPSFCPSSTTGATRLSSCSRLSGMPRTLRIRPTFSDFRVPTPAELTGDFSGLCTGGFNTAGLCTSGTQLYVPNSPLDSGNNRTEYFINNNIAASTFGLTTGGTVAGTPAINATGVALASYMPTPNVAGSTASSSAIQSNYVPVNDTYPSTYPSFIGRFDYELGPERQGECDRIPFRTDADLSDVQLS